LLYIALQYGMARARLAHALRAIGKRVQDAEQDHVQDWAG
jgi:hypothetical protein